MTRARQALKRLKEALAAWRLVEVELLNRRTFISRTVVAMAASERQKRAPEWMTLALSGPTAPV